MQTKLIKQTLAQTYLTIVPIAALIIAFAIGHVSYKIYIPISIINVCLMVLASWTLYSHDGRANEVQDKYYYVAGIFFIIPSMLISLFVGMGPPPESLEGWVATATEQQTRYLILVAVGVFIALGFRALREGLKGTKGDFYSLIGITLIMIAIPLFILNIIYWGTYLVELFKIVVASGSETMPDWFRPIRKLFGVISLVEVSLIYLATAAFAAALRYANLIGKTACRIYLTISFLGFSIMLLSFVEPLATVSDIVSIPAIPFLMPYFMGINLLGMKKLTSASNE